MSFETLPHTPPVTLPCIGALVPNSRISTSRFHDNRAALVTVINHISIAPFRLGKNKKRGIAPPLFALVFVSACVLAGFVLGYCHRFSGLLGFTPSGFHLSLFLGLSFCHLRLYCCLCLNISLSFSLRFGLSDYSFILCHRFTLR